MSNYGIGPNEWRVLLQEQASLEARKEFLNQSEARRLDLLNDLLRPTDLAPMKGRSC